MVGTSRRITIYLLAGLTVVLAGIAIVVGLRLQNTGTSTAPPSISAAGFGENATRDLYPAFEQFFADLDCTGLLPKDSIVNILGMDDYTFSSAFKADMPTKVADIDLTDEGSAFKNPKNCTYTLGDTGKSIVLTMSTYDASSVIDNTPQQLYDRINVTNMGTPTRTLSNRYSIYFYGTGKAANTCVLNIFHVQNDFERVTVTLEGFGSCSDSGVEEYGSAVGEIISDYLFVYVKKVNELNDYTPLCDGWARERTIYCKNVTCEPVICQGGEWAASDEFYCGEKIEGSDTCLIIYPEIEEE